MGTQKYHNQSIHKNVLSKISSWKWKKYGFENDLDLY